MKNKLILTSMLLFTGLSTHVVATDISPQVMANYQAGLRGNAEANIDAISELTSQLKGNNKDATVMALLGSSETAQARYLDQPWQKMKIADKGLAKLDRALRLVDGKMASNPKISLQVNTTAGCTFVKLPKMFNRFEQGVDLLDLTIKSNAFDYMPVGSKITAYMCAASAAQASDEKQTALTYLAQIKEIAPQGPHIESVEKMRAQMED